MAKQAKLDEAAAGENTSDAPLQPAPLEIGRSKPLVFISHDSRDFALAEAFENLLTDVSAGTLKAFRSSDKKGGSGIEFGTEWYRSIMNKISRSTDVVALLTSNSLGRPWILYEAGVAKGQLEITVLGLALGIPLDRASTGPFSQFQNCGDDDDSLVGLVMQLLQRNPDASPREEAIRRQVETFQERKRSILATHPQKEPSAQEVDDQHSAKLFEEIKAMIRDLADRSAVADRNESRKDNQTARIDPVFVEKIFRSLSQQSKQGSTPWYVIASLLRDTTPWLHDILLEFGRRLDNRNLIPARQLAVDIHNLIEDMTFRSTVRPPHNINNSEINMWLGNSLHHLLEASLELASSRRGTQSKSLED